MFGIYESSPYHTRHRHFPDQSFASVEDAITFLGGSVLDYEIEPDGSAGDVFTWTGRIYVIEPIEKGI